MRHHLTAACSALLLAAAAVVPGVLPASATTPDDRGEVEERQGQVQEGLEASRGDLAHVAAELVAASNRLAELQAQLPGARAAVDQAQAEAAAARQRDAELAEQLSLAEAAVTAAGLELEERTGEADATEKVVASVAREVYQGSGFTPLTILVEAEQAARDAQAVLEGLVVQEDQAVAAFAAAKAAEEAEIAALEAEEDRLAAQLAAIAEAERLAEIERQRQIEAERQRLAELERQRQAEIQRQREAAARNNRPVPPPPPPVPAGPSDTSVPSGNGFLSRPTGTRVTSSFGYRIHPILGYRRLHTGTDFGGPCGTPITAAADGRVVSAGWGGGYGNLVVITHGIVGGSSLATAYAHQSSMAVSPGQEVSRGQVIGYIGTTGSSTGCHLHFETRVAGVPVDPMNYL